MDSVKTIVTPETMSNVDSIFGSSIGKSAFEIDTSYVRAVLALLTAAADQLKIKKIVTATTLEDPITYLLDEEMRVFQRANRSDIIRWVIQPNIKRDSTDPLLRCEPDIVFLWMDEEADPDLGLYAEAKRLFGTGPSLASKYVVQGVLDFVEARYGRSHNYGIMVGYVLTAPLKKAVSSVKRAMSERKIKTSESSAFSPDISLCPHPYTHHSSHLQKGTVTPMTLIHLFLDFA